jgi:hypothetical protein
MNNSSVREKGISWRGGMAYSPVLRDLETQCFYVILREYRGEVS